MSKRKMLVLCVLLSSAICVLAGCSGTSGTDQVSKSASSDQSGKSSQTSVSSEIDESQAPEESEEVQPSEEFSEEESSAVDESSQTSDSSAEESSEISVSSEEESSESPESLRIAPETHYYGTGNVNGIDVRYDLHMPSESMILVTAPTDIGGSIDYSLSGITYSDGTYSYTSGTQSEYVPGAMRSLVAASALSGYVKVIDENTVEWCNNAGDGGMSFTITMTKG